MLLPDSSVATAALNQIAGWALALAILAAIGGGIYAAILWGVGRAAGEPDRVADAKKILLRVLIGAFILGAAPAFVAYLVGLGSGALPLTPSPRST